MPVLFRLIQFPSVYERPAFYVIFTVLCQTLPTQSVDLLHDHADLVLHPLAGLALRGELHETDLFLSFTEIDLLAVFVIRDADAVSVVAALHIIQVGGNQMVFEKLLQFFHCHDQ